MRLQENMSELKPIKLWGKVGPNPPKVVILLEELSLPYEVVPMELSNVKTPEFLEINPNGRIPAIYDPNRDLTLWESGAIVEYLVEQYDTDNKLSFLKDSNESYHAKQWLYYQVSGQGPYYGQAGWFIRYHSEKVPSAIERYVNEVKRVTSVLEDHLAKQKTSGDGPWLVGDKFTYADLSFVPWQAAVEWALKEQGFISDDYPHVKYWIERMMSRPIVKRVIDEAFKV